MAKPIFVVGKNRSGTKWVSNTVSNHPSVASIQRPEAGGILETNMFLKMRQIFGDLSVDDNYIAFATCFSETNFYKLTGLENEFLFKNKHDNYLDVFRDIMDEYTKRQKKQYWIQKTSPHALEQVYRKFSDGRFILVKRKLLDNVRSSIALKIRDEELRKRSIPAEVFSYVYQNKILKKYEVKHNTKTLMFEDMKANKQKTCHNIASFIGVTYDKCMLYDRYKKNSSFEGEVNKKDALTNYEEYIVQQLYYIAAIFPLIVLKPIKNIRDILEKVFLSGNEKEKFMPKTFDIKKESINL